MCFGKIHVQALYQPIIIYDALLYINWLSNPFAWYENINIIYLFLYIFYANHNGNCDYLIMLVMFWMILRCWAFFCLILNIKNNYLNVIKKNFSTIKKKLLLKHLICLYANTLHRISIKALKINFEKKFQNLTVHIH